MLECYKIALTGPIGSGKSTALRYFKELGAFTVSADQIVHHLLSTHTDLGKKIVRLLGNEILVNGEISRPLISEKVFTNYSLLKDYEAIIHPEVQKEIDNRFLKQSSMDTLLVAEVPLLFEANLQGHYDASVYIYADVERRKKRFLASAPHLLDEFERRESRLLPEDRKKALATYVLSNNASKEKLRDEVKTLYKQLTLSWKNQ